MKLLRFLLYAYKSDRGARWLGGLSLLVGALAGIANVAALAAVTALAVDPSAGSFVRLAVITAASLMTSVGSQLLVLHLSQNAIRDLRLSIARRVLGVPLAQLEEAGSPAILAIFAEDIWSVANAVGGRRGQRPLLLLLDLHAHYWTP